MSVNEKPPEEQQDTPPISLPQYLGHALAGLEYQELPNVAEELWYLTKATDDNGKTVNFVTVTMNGVNLVFTNWFDEEHLEAHIARATNALMKLRSVNAASGKLVTATNSDMQTLNEMARRSGIVLPGN